MIFSIAAIIIKLQREGGGGDKEGREREREWELL